MNGNDRERTSLQEDPPLLPSPSFNPITKTHSEFPCPSQKEAVVASVSRNPEVICKAYECVSHLSTPRFPKTGSGRHYKRHTPLPAESFNHSPLGLDPLRSLLGLVRRLKPWKRTHTAP